MPRLAKQGALVGRWLSMLLGVQLLFVCVGPNAAASGDDGSLVLWHSYRGAEEVALLKVLSHYEKESGHSVRALGIPYDAFASKLTTAIPRNNGPDLFIFAHERLGGWVEAKMLTALDGVVPEAELGEFFEATVDPLRYEGKLYGLPLAFKSLVLYYNKALVPRPPATTDDLLQIGRQLRQQKIYGLAYQSSLFYFHAPWFFGFGGELNFDGREPGFSSPGALGSFQFLQQLYAEGLMPDEVTGALVTQLFNEGRTGMVVNGPWFLGEITPGTEFGVAPLPRVSSTGAPARPFLTDEAVFVSSKTTRTESAMALARYLAGKESSRIRLTLGKQLVAHRKVWQEEGLADDPVMGVFAQQLNHVVPMHNGPQMQNFWEPGDLALKKLIRGGASPREAGLAGSRRYQAITQPPPPPVNSTPYGVVFAFVVVAVCAWLVRNVVQIIRRGQWEDFRYGWSWVFPGMMALGVLVFIPFVVSLALAFFSHRAGEWTFVGMGNFVSILSAKSFDILEPLSFYYALVVTLAWTLINLMFHLGAGVGLALLLNQKGLRLRGLYRVLLIIPWAVPNYITALIWKGMFHRQFGAINAMVQGMGGEAVAWFSSFGTAFFANICTNAWLGFPFIMVVCLGALQAIPDELYDAADVDGAGRWAKFRLITLPLLRPSLLPAALLGIIWTFNQFNIVYLVSSGEPDNSTDILISEVYRWAFARQEQYGYASAYAGLIFVLLLGWSAWSTRVARRVEDMT